MYMYSSVSDLMSPIIVSAGAKRMGLWKCVLSFPLLLLCLPLWAQFTVGGTASSLGNGCYRLTNAANSQAGYVYQNAPINLQESFDYRFSVNLGSSNGGADGMVFVLRGSLGTPYIGTGGGGLGFLNLSGTNVGGTVGVEVDTWQNGGYGDPTYDHIGILSQASANHAGATALSGVVQASATSANVEDGNYHTLNIRWDATAKELDVYFDCNYRLQYQGDLVDSIFNGDSLVHWGFVATTGAANNDQRFCFTVPIDSLFTPLDSHAICKGDSVQLNAGTSALNYAWSPSGGLSSSTIGNPWAYPTTTTNYMVTASYQCDTIIDTSHIAVTQPDFNLSNSVTEPLCFDDCNGEIDLTVNGPSIYAFDWNTGATTEDVTALCDDTYYVTVQDTVTTSPNYLCFVSDTITVNEPTQLTASIGNATAVTCPAALYCDASALADGAGGTPPYSFQWSTSESTQLASGLCADSNFVTVTDANGCDTSAFVVIQVPDSIVTTASSDVLICITNNAPITATSSGGTPPYSYVWTAQSLNGPVVSTQASDAIDPHVSTRYFVTSTDSNGCPGDTSTLMVNVRPPLSVEVPPVDTICPYDTISLSASGLGGDSIYTYSWSSGGFGPTQDVSPNQPRWYHVTVSDFCGTPSFTDSVFVQVGGYQEIKASLRVEDDSLCVGENIYVIATGAGGHNGPNEYEYTWNKLNWDDRSHHFDTPLSNTVYAVTISDLCLSPVGSDTITVHVGQPARPVFDAYPKQACAHADVAIVLEDRQVGYDYNWSLGDGWYEYNTQTDTVAHAYNTPGCYDVAVHVTTDFGCTSTRTIPCMVEVLPLPEPGFKRNPLHPTTLDPWVEFYDASANTETVAWMLDGELLSDERAFTHEFMDTGTYAVTLIATSPDGCLDSISDTLLHRLAQTVYLPNSFTPNGDGHNDEFGIVGEAIGLEGFELTVYDRWGNTVFYSQNPAFKWNGTLATKRSAPMGSYGYVLRYLDSYNDQKTLTGQVMIVKSKDLED